MPPQRDEERGRRPGAGGGGGGAMGEYAATVHVDQHVDQLPVMEPLVRASAMRRESFIAEFGRSNGGPQIMILAFLVAIGFGSTIGVVSGSSFLRAASSKNR